MRQANKIIIYMILLVVLMQSASAIGVSPASTKIDFEPGLEKEVTVRILNNEHKDFNAMISIEGDLEDYITLEHNMIEISADESSKSFTYRVKLPNQLSKPGNHKTGIIIAEQPKTGSGLAVVAASAAVESQLIVQVPYPGKYAEAELHVSKAKLNERTQFAVAVFNLGKENLEDVWAKIEIYEKGDKIGEVETSKIDVQSKDKARLSEYWLAEKPGVYKAVATVYYAGKIIELEQDFEVGGLDIRIDGLNIYDFRLGDIARMYTIITNNWNEKISDVFGEITIRDNQGAPVSELKTPSVDLGAFSTASLVSYWDTENIYIGKYSIDVIVNYKGLKVGRTFEADVYQDKVMINGMPTGQAIAEQPLFTKPTGMTLLVIILINLIIINILLIRFLRKRPPKTEIISKFLLFLQ